MASAARADGDPASDYLLGQPAFLPPDAAIPPAYSEQLTTVLADAKALGYVIRVALIATRYDMGSVTALYRQPKRYARFLGEELYFVYKGRLLVVMPNGYGVSRGGKELPAQEARVDRFPAPGASGAALAAAATRSVRRLAAADGVSLALPPLKGATHGENENHDRIVIAGGAVAVLLVGFGASVVRRRFRGARAAS